MPARINDGGLTADDLPEPTHGLREFYEAVDGVSRGRKREYYSLDEIPGIEPCLRERLDHAVVAAQLDEPDRAAELAGGWLDDPATATDSGDEDGDGAAR